MSHPYCNNCYYHCKTTDTCDYCLIEDELRGCPPGPGCTKRITRKEHKKMSNTKWDRVKGRQMWLDGKTDREIAEVWGVHPSVIGQVRRKVWELEPGAPKKAHDKKPAAGSNVPAQEPGAPKKAHDKKPAAGSNVPEQKTAPQMPETVAPPAEEPAQPASCHEIATPKETEFFGLVAELVKDKQGMDAVITAQVVIALVKGDLEEAQRCIAWLIANQ